MKKILSYASNIKNQLINSYIINRVDRRAKKNIMNIEDKDFRIGYKFFENSLSKDELSYLNEYFTHRNFFSSETIRLFEFVEKNFLGYIQSYLGKNTKLYSIDFNTIEPNKKNKSDISASWHNDNLGNNLKIYICLEGYGDCPTGIVPNENTKNYYPNIFFNLRSLGKINQKLKKDEIDLKYKTGDCAIFDTISPHRGKYEKINNSKRKCIILNFLDIEKIEKLGFLENPKFLFIKNTKPPFRKILPKNFTKKNDDIVTKLKKFKFFDERFLVEDNEMNSYLWS